MSAPSLTAAAAQLFFPQRECLLCGGITAQPGLCAACAACCRALPRCNICAAFISAPGLCGHCAATRPLFAESRAAAPYAGRLRDSLRGFKYLEKTWLRRPLAMLLALTYEEYYHGLSFDAVTPIPLSPRRFQERGYNQSELLSKLLAAEYGLPHQPGLLARVLDTPPLATYSGAQRRSLLKRAFKAQATQGRTVLLVDDIYTSGATMNACAAVLLAAGARQVYGLTVAAYDARNDGGVK